MLKTVILIGGPSKGTRFRPLSLDMPKPLFPIAGFPMIYHHIEAASKIANMKEIILIGSYQPSKELTGFISSMQQDFKVIVRYLQEYTTTLGTAGGMYHFRDQILSGDPALFFVMNADVCGDFPLQDMLNFHRSIGNTPHFTILATEATRQQSINYGCIVENKDTHQVTHYVEKPSTFVSTLISCGIYLFSPEIFEYIGTAFKKLQEDITFDVETTLQNRAVIRMEQDIFARELMGSGLLYVYQTSKFWSQVKSAGAAVYANRHYLNIYQRTHPEWLSKNDKDKPNVIGDVYIHPTAVVHPTATLGPNVTISKNVQIGAGVRIRESIILQGAVIQDHCCILYSIVGWTSFVGEWTRIEGTPNDPNPNKPFAKLDISDLFQPDGRLSPSITVIGSNVHIPPEIIVLNSIVLPDKDLERSYKNQIIL